MPEQKDSQVDAGIQEFRRLIRLPSITLKESTVAAQMMGAGVVLPDLKAAEDYIKKTIHILSDRSYHRLNGESQSKYLSLTEGIKTSQDINTLLNSLRQLMDLVEWEDTTQEGLEFIRILRYVHDSLAGMQTTVASLSDISPAC